MLVLATISGIGLANQLFFLGREIWKEPLDRGCAISFSRRSSLMVVS